MFDVSGKVVVVTGSSRGIGKAIARPLWEGPERRERAKNRTPLRRMGEPEDIAGIAHFLASDAAAYITGQVIVADGGETIC